MEGSSALPSDSNNQNSPAAGDGAAKFLANLPSRGLFSSTVLSSNLVLHSFLIFLFFFKILSQEKKGSIEFFFLILNGGFICDFMMEKEVCLRMLIHSSKMLVENFMLNFSVNIVKLFSGLL